MRQYSAKLFFKSVSNTYLGSLFNTQGYLYDFDFDNPGKHKELLFQAWLNLPEADRNRLNLIFQEIFELSSERGLKAINGAIESETNNCYSIREKLAKLPNNYDRACEVFLENKLLYWDKILLYYHTDNLSNWRKRKQLPRKKVRKDPQTLQNFANVIGYYFHTAEAKGKNCTVETLRRGELDYFFAYPEDYPRVNWEWINDEFEMRSSKPAFEIVFAYNQNEGFLDLNYRGDNSAIPELQRLFIQHILGDDAKNIRDVCGVYDLNPIIREDFKFRYHPNSLIQDVRICSIRLTSKLNGRRKVEIFDDYITDQDAVRKCYEELIPTSARHEYNVTQANFTATVWSNSKKNSKRFSFSVTYPNYCTLKYDAEHLRLRKMLEDSGIELREDPQSDTI